MSSSVRPPPLALVPLAAGFLGAIAVDHFVGDRAEAAPLVVNAPTSTSIVLPTHPSLQVEAGEPTVVERAAPLKLSSSTPAVPAVTTSTKPATHVTAGAVLTREKDLEAQLEKMLVDGKTPYAATVLLEAGTGRIIAVAEHSTRGPSEGLAFKPIAPAASVFKIVTSSALLQSGVSPSTNVCIHGGKTRMQPSLLVDNAKRDRDCTTLSDALSHSQNVAIAKLALKHLDPDTLRAEAQRWGFDALLPVDSAPGLEKSTTHIPDDPFGFANAAAGFGEVKLSALHGAVLASIVANGGVLVPPQMIDHVDGGDEPRPPEPRRVIPSSVAKKLQAMMTDTVVEGTGRKTFSNGPRLGVSAAGKTGSLADYDTGLDTSWFVGFAPADRPEVIVASVVVNTSKWHIKAPLVAKEALRAYFKAHGPTKKAAVVASR
jgi:cell division protein FtsI/penicillin-binding protein 2